MARTKVFVSYSHEDRDWLNRLGQHLAVLERQGLVDLWSDARIEVGASWEGEIESALSEAKVAVLLVSPAFLASSFVWSKEMPRIIAHADQGMDVLPLILRPCAWRLEGALARLQARPTDARPLSLVSESQVDSDLSAFAYELAAKIGRSPAAAPYRDASSGRSSKSAERRRGDLTGEWTGYYNQARPIRLWVHEDTMSSFRGTMEYPAEGTVTFVEGVVYERGARDDELWAQIHSGTSEVHHIAVSFKETGYQHKGRSAISFDGEYRAFATDNDMTGAWFAGHRLVGPFTLRRS
jgi:hypothetical protein